MGQPTIDREEQRLKSVRKAIRGNYASFLMVMQHCGIDCIKRVSSTDDCISLMGMGWKILEQNGRNEYLLVSMKLLEEKEGLIQ